jgi:hypothetical protein
VISYKNLDSQLLLKGSSESLSIPPGAAITRSCRTQATLEAQYGLLSHQNPYLCYCLPLLMCALCGLSLVA